MDYYWCSVLKSDALYLQKTNTSTTVNMKTATASGVDIKTLFSCSSASINFLLEIHLNILQ